MPNWCSNTLVVTPKDNEKKSLVELKAFYIENKGNIDGEYSDLVFNNGVPVPKNISGEQEFHFRIEYWGTKWEASDVDFQNNGTELVYNFETAWAPPIPWVEKISKEYPNLVLSLEFEESGVGLYGGIRAIDGDVEEWENDQPGDPDSEIDAEEAYEVLKDGDEIMVKGWDSDEPRLYAGVTIEDFEGMSKEEIIDQLSEYDSIQLW